MEHGLTKNQMSVAIFFDAWVGCGFGHASRSLSIAHSFYESGFQIRYFAIKKSEESEVFSLEGLVEKDHFQGQVFSRESFVFQACQYDFAVIDSYTEYIQNLDWLQNFNSNTKLIAFCDSVWKGFLSHTNFLKKFYAILDATYSLESLSEVKFLKLYYGAEDGVFLDKNLLKFKENRPVVNIDAAIILGESSNAANLRPCYTKLFKGLDLYNSCAIFNIRGTPKYKIVKLDPYTQENCSNPLNEEYHIYDIMKFSNNLAVSAGQMFWEALFFKDSFWLLELNLIHKNVIKTMKNQGVIKIIRSIPLSLQNPDVTGDNRDLCAHFIQANFKTRENLLQQNKRFLKMLLNTE